MRSAAEMLVYWDKRGEFGKEGMPEKIWKKGG
jgi:hypothetical protein